MTADAMIVTTTVADRDTAVELARSAVGARLAACAQVGGPVTSVYRWRGAIESALEYTVAFKTTAALAEALVARVKASHPYQVPEILLSTASGSADYLAWIVAETGPATT